MSQYKRGWKDLFIVVGVAFLLTLLPGNYGNLGAFLLLLLIVAFVLFEANYYNSTQPHKFFTYGDASEW